MNLCLHSRPSGLRASRWAARHNFTSHEKSILMRQQLISRGIVIIISIAENERISYGNENYGMS
jgi:hypothetical protein